jgi:hypothetical protein
MEDQHPHRQWCQQQCCLKALDAQQAAHHSNKEVDGNKHLR